MKTILLILLFLFSLSINGLLAQDSLQIALLYYPLNDGDYWEYSQSFWHDPYYSETSYFSIEVVGDTILVNEKKYKILERRTIPDDGQSSVYFERIDSSTANIYRYREDFDLPENEFLLDSLLSQEGDTSKSTRDESDFSSWQTVCTGIDSLEILGQETSVKSYWDQSFIPGFQYDLAMGFGYIGDFNCEISCGSTTLQYALIEGVEYGTKISAIKEEELNLEKNFYLHQNYPNPFNPTTTISFYLPERSMIEISLFDIRGSYIENIVSKIYSSGFHSIVFDGSKLSSGQYIYTLNSGNTNISRKLILLK
jgi:hypothetical protein